VCEDCGVRAGAYLLNVEETQERLLLDAILDGHRVVASHQLHRRRVEPVRDV
jgi:hypothetical protein